MALTLAIIISMMMDASVGLTEGSTVGTKKGTFATGGRAVSTDGAEPRMYTVQFAPPTLVGQSNHSDPCTTSGKVPSNGTRWGTVPCHYWFPISFLQLGTGPSAAFLLGVGAPLLHSSPYSTVVLGS